MLVIVVMVLSVVALALAAPARASSPRRFRVIATSEEPQQLSDGSYGDASRVWASLPDPSARGRTLTVIRDTGEYAEGPIPEVGPWNVDDPYWVGTGAPREAKGELVAHGPNAARVTNGAGLDLSWAFWQALGVPHPENYTETVTWFFSDGGAA